MSNLVKNMSYLGRHSKIHIMEIDESKTNSAEKEIIV